ncbi:MAG: DUF1294 domain-containing protein [Methanospirillum sp.]|nr:DUF1294 domain-containing protein [Methanospirillum sp.]
MIPIDPFLPAIVALAAVNLGTFLLYGADKRYARLQARRVPERTLLVAALAGPFGALAGMSLFRHKTRKLRFVVAVPLCASLHVVVAVALAASAFRP